MNCFQHTQKPAVGHCMFCGRGLCHDCATVIEGKLSCRGACQHEIARERRLIAQSETAMGQRSIAFETSSGVYQRSFAFSSVTGIGLLIFGIVLFIKQVTIAGVILIGMGVMMLISAVGMARASKNYKALAAQGRDEGTQS